MISLWVCFHRVDASFVVLAGVSRKAGQPPPLVPHAPVPSQLGAGCNVKKHTWVLSIQPRGSSQGSVPYGQHLEDPLVSPHTPHPLRASPLPPANSVELFLLFLDLMEMESSLSARLHQSKQMRWLRACVDPRRCHESNKWRRSLHGTSPTQNHCC